MEHARTVLLVSHGQPSDPEVGEREIGMFAQAIQAQAPDMVIEGVTLAAQDRLEERAGAVGPTSVVYPLFMADGWFTQVQLPRRLGGASLEILPPYGVDPQLTHFAVGWMQDVLEMRGWSAEETTLIVVGHGSGRSRKPAEVTERFAAGIADQLPFAELRTGFVEEDPRLLPALSGAPRRAICLPFFATRRGHVREDLPEALEQAEFAGQVLDPIGLHPCTPGFIAMRLREMLAGDVRQAASA